MPRDLPKCETANVRPDTDLDHLYPEFRRRVLAVLAELKAVTNVPWRIVQGFRPREYQEYLYSLGRTRPGRIVTWTRDSLHLYGLAADFLPEGKSYADVPRSWWVKLYETGKKHGLRNPAWRRGDLGHLELGGPEWTKKAREWIRLGMPSEEPAAEGESYRLYLEGREEPIFHRMPVRDGVAYCPIEPLARRLHLAYRWNAEKACPRIGGIDLEGDVVWLPVPGYGAVAHAPIRQIVAALGWRLALDAERRAITLDRERPAPA